MPRPTEDAVTVTVRIPIWLTRWLEDEAAKQGLTRSDIIRMILLHRARGLRVDESRDLIRQRVRMD